MCIRDRSIARYCWKKDAYCYQEFIDRQSRKGRLGGLKSNSSNGGITRAKKYEEQKRIALELKKKGLNNTEISLAVNVSRRTVINWFKGD